MIDLNENDLLIVKGILRKYAAECEVRVFGSRIQDSATRFSDLDLVLISKNKIDWRFLENLKNAFSESELPIQVDVVDWNTISKSFQEVISRHYEVIQPLIL